MATSGEKSWPPAGRNDGHQWGILWPPVGRNRWPLTRGCDSVVKDDEARFRQGDIAEYACEPDQRCAAQHADQQGTARADAALGCAAARDRTQPRGVSPAYETPLARVASWACGGRRSNGDTRKEPGTRGRRSTTTQVPGGQDPRARGWSLVRVCSAPRSARNAGHIKISTRWS